MVNYHSWSFTIFLTHDTECRMALWLSFGFMGDTILLSLVKIVKHESTQYSVAKLSQAEPTHGDMAHDNVVTCQKTVE